MIKITYPAVGDTPLMEQRVSQLNGNEMLEQHLLGVNHIKKAVLCLCLYEEPLLASEELVTAKEDKLIDLEKKKDASGDKA